MRIEPDYGMKQSMKDAESTEKRFSSCYCVNVDAAAYHAKHKGATAMDAKVEGCSMLQRWVGTSVGYKMQRNEMQGVVTTIYVLLLLSLSVLAIFIAFHLCKNY